MIWAQGERRAQLGREFPLPVACDLCLCGSVLSTAGMVSGYHELRETGGEQACRKQ